MQGQKTPLLYMDICPKSPKKRTKIRELRPIQLKKEGQFRAVLTLQNQNATAFRQKSLGAPQAWRALP